MTAERLTELLAPFLGGARLSADQLDEISAYLDLLLKWNSKMNLTAVRGPQAIVTRHFGESFFAARHLFPERARESVIDIGSGAGFPGLPFKIWARALQITLVESNQKKSVFLKEAIRVTGVEGVYVETQRAENLDRQTDVVSFRAVEHFEKVLPIARRLLKPAGRLALLIGGAQVKVAETILAGLDWDSPFPIPCSTNRVLLVGQSA